MVVSPITLAGPDWPVPDFLTLHCRKMYLAWQVPFRRSGGLLFLQDDRAGIKFLLGRKRQAGKQGEQGRHQWRNVHLAMVTVTSDIRAAEFIPSRGGDFPVLPGLLG